MSGYNHRFGSFFYNRLRILGHFYTMYKFKLYPVKMTLGPKSFDEQVAAQASSVSFAVKDEKFTDALRSASALRSSLGALEQMVV